MRKIEPMHKPNRVRSEGQELRHQRRLSERNRQADRSEAVMVSEPIGKGYMVLCRDWQTLTNTFKPPHEATHPVQHGTYCDGPHSRIEWCHAKRRL